jgi:hypothetical protein
MSEYYNKNVDKNASQQENKRMIVGYTQIVVQILKGLLDIADSQVFTRVYTVDINGLF